MLVRVVEQGPTLQVVDSTESKPIEQWERLSPDLWLFIEVTREGGWDIHEGKLIATAKDASEFTDVARLYYQRGISTITIRSVYTASHPVGRESCSSQGEANSPDDTRSVNSFWGFSHRLLVDSGLWPSICRRKILVLMLLFAVLVFGGGYVGLRHFNVFASSAPSLLDISGPWKYQCRAIGSAVFDHGGFEHGGSVEIKQTQERFGTVIAMNGDRLWTSRKEPNGSVRTADCDPTIHWRSDDGSFTKADEIRFSYQAPGQPAAFKGFAEGKVEMKDGKPYAIKGTFYCQLPEGKMMCGSFEMRRN